MRTEDSEYDLLTTGSFNNETAQAPSVDVWAVFCSLIRTSDLWSKVLSFENTKKNKFSFWCFAHLFVPLQAEKQ
jgi:hypothetical protein